MDPADLAHIPDEQLIISGMLCLVAGSLVRSAFAFGRLSAVSDRTDDKSGVHLRFMNSLRETASEQRKQGRLLPVCNQDDRREMCRLMQNIWEKETQASRVPKGSGARHICCISNSCPSVSSCSLVQPKQKHHATGRKISVICILATTHSSYNNSQSDVHKWADAHAAVG